MVIKEIRVNKPKKKRGIKGEEDKEKEEKMGEHLNRQQRSLGNVESQPTGARGKKGGDQKRERRGRKKSIRE